MATGHILTRTVFQTSRVLEFFTDKELTMQIGFPRQQWPLALLKELLDNALDACEMAGQLPDMTVTVTEDTVSVQDNGPGLLPATLERSLDYLVRVSDKAHYVSPTRGQLGNALKCIWAAPYVVDGTHGRVEVGTGGVTYQIDVTLDQIAQEPTLELTTRADAFVKSGTRITIHWPGIASCLADAADATFYNVEELLHRYAAFNPHAHFQYVSAAGPVWQWGCTTPTWPKWQPQHPTSPHWYTVERFQALLAAYLTQDRYQGRVRSVREVVAEFAGLKGTAAQKAVTADAGLSGASLEALVVDGGMDVPRVRALLKAMQARSHLIKPTKLGVIGDTHLRTIMGERLGVDPESLTYKKYMGEVEGMPYVVELACGWFVDWDGEQEGTKLLGVNWTPALRPPFAYLDYLLDEAQVECYDPVVLAIHLAYPRVEVTDRGKSAAALPGAITQVLETGVTTVTKPWRALKRQADHTRRVRLRDMEYWRKQHQRQWLTVKAAAAQVMEAAYHKASGGNRFPANARQIMYAARGDIITLTNKNPPWKHSAYFTQHLLPDFINEHPDLTRDWDVIFDARGHLIEPHTGYQLGIGTLEVREYLASWHGRIPTTLEAFMVQHAIATRGPRHRYQYALFVEKEGFHPLLERAQMAARYDVTLMSTKGMSVVAARRLLEELTRAGVTTLVLHDCDKAGFEILDKFRSDTRRHTYAIQPTVEDLGLRLADAQAMGLQSEQVYYQGQKDPRESLRRCGATPAECAFLVQRRVGEGWEGERIELNAMDSVTFITWLEAKLVAAGVRKLVPEGEALTAAYQRMALIAMLQRALDTALASLPAPDTIPVPTGLAETIRAAITNTADPWDEALWKIVCATQHQARHP